MSKVVTATIVRYNQIEYGSTPRVEAVPADKYKSEGLFWRVPIADGTGILTGYAYTKDAAKPTADSCRVLRVYITNTTDTYWLAVPDDAAPDIFDQLANECCGDTIPAMPAVTVPDVFIEEKPCPDANGNYVYFAITDVAIAPQVYQLQLVANGAVVTPAPPAEGFATLADLVTWATANYGDYGTWTNPALTTKVVLTSAPNSVKPVKSGVISITIATSFDSNAAPSLAAGEQFSLVVTADGITYPAVTGAALADVVTAAQANAALSTLGQYAAITGNKIRLTSTTVSNASLVISAVPTT
jgi:hypothetical protein